MIGVPHPGLDAKDQPDAVLATLRASQGGLVRVSGLPAVGTSQWCLEFIHLARRSRTVACSADAHESTAPLALVDKFVRGLGSADGVRGLLELTDPVAVGRALLVAIAERRSGLNTFVINDVQWMDPLSASALRFVLPRITDEKLSVVLAGEGSDGARVIDDLVGGDALSWPTTVTVQIPPLTAAQAQTHVAEHYGRDLSLRSAQHLVDATGGLLVLIDLTMKRAAMSRGGGDAADVDNPWLDALPLLGADRNPFATVVADVADPAMRRALEYVSVLPDRTSQIIVEQMARQLDEEIDLSAAIRAQLVTAHRAADTVLVRPVHRLLASAVLDGLARARRSALHHAAAEVSVDPGRRLFHRLAVDEPGTDELREVLEVEVDRAIERGRPEVAVAHLRSAIPRFTGPARGDLVIEAVFTATGHHLSPLVIDLLPELESLPSDPIRDFALVQLIAFGPDYNRTLRSARELAETPLDIADADLVRSHLDMVALMGLLTSPHPEPATELVTRAHVAIDRWAASGPVRDRRLRHCLGPADVRLSVDGFALSIAGVRRDADALFAALGDLEAGISTASDSPALVDALTCRGGFLIAVGQPAAAVTDLTRAVEIVASRGTGMTGGHTRVVLSYAHAALGHLIEARAVSDESVMLAFDAVDLSSRPLVFFVAAWLDALQGRTAEFAASIQRGRDVRITDYATVGVDFEALAEAEFARTRGDREGQLAATPGLPDGFDPTDPNAAPPFETLALAAYRIDALAALDRGDEADRLLELCRRFNGLGWWPVFGGLDWLEGRVAESLGLTDRAATAYRAAAEDRSQPLLAGLAWLDLGAMWVAKSDRTKAVTALNRAARAFRTVGATAYLDRAVALLDEVEEREGDARVRAFDLLTGREREVALLAARGLMNKEIADQLFIASTTVSFHMRNVLGKLELSSRRGLRSMLEGAATE